MQVNIFLNIIVLAISWMQLYRDIFKYHIDVFNYHYCTLRGRDQRLKCAIISIFYGAVLYLPNFWKIQHTWANIALLAKTCFRRYLAYPAIKQ